MEPVFATERPTSATKSPRIEPALRTSPEATFHPPTPTRRSISKASTEKAELMWARVAAGAAVCVAGYFGINPPGFVSQVVAFAFGLAASSFFPPIIMGVFNKKANKEGAMTGMVVGIVFTAAYIIYFKFVNPAANVPANWWFGISPEGIGTVGMILNFVIMWVVSKITHEPPLEVQQLVESLRYPKESTHV